MKDVVVIGAGKIGATVAGLLAGTGDYAVTLTDRSADVLGRLEPDERLRTVAVDVEDSAKLLDLLNGKFAVLNAGPFHLTTAVAEAARAARTHYLDLTEDVARARAGAGTGRRCRHRLHSPVRPGARLHLDRRLRHGQALHHARQRAAAGRARCRNIPPTRSTTI